MNVMGALSLGVYAIPILFILWKVVRTPLRSWLPFLFLIGLILLIQGLGELIGADTMTTLMYWLAGFRW
ncbi:hypothetical protein DC522_04890 [Microvirga sp. KLBC 81]|nr:hypothetical protein DC522_04890 [Microvirga sp. KLBC 81]